MQDLYGYPVLGTLHQIGLDQKVSNFSQGGCYCNQARDEHVEGLLINHWGLQAQAVGQKKAGTGMYRRWEGLASHSRDLGLFCSGSPKKMLFSFRCPFKTTKDGVITLKQAHPFASFPALSQSALVCWPNMNDLTSRGVVFHRCYLKVPFIGMPQETGEFYPEVGREPSEWHVSGGAPQLSPFSGAHGLTHGNYESLALGCGVW